jgi:serine/threonine protein phosphatase PrpC
MMISASGLTHLGGPRNRENQDAFHVGTRRFCVVDGHGKHGKRVAEAARDCFAAAADGRSFEDMFAEAETVVRSQLPPSSYDESGEGGTTASVLQIADDGTCRVAAVGDSEVRVFDDNESDGITLNEDHSASSLEEFRRIQAVAPATRFEFTNPPAAYHFCYGKKPVFIQGADSEWMLDVSGGYTYSTVRKEWSAYVVGRNGEHLAMTRAIGDFNMKNSGIIATPSEMSVGPPAAGVVRAIVMASDGLWDAMQYAEVRDIVRNPALIGNAEAATTALMEAARAAGATHFGSNSDNVTAIVVYLTV